ncbi:hypothetical protein SAMN05877753_108202 [Bacillus oleivorans]|uniref:Uncharacterized protein n=1 Tax=Bacillus oleivorans TaxID=1448271 RepID=A0A285D3A8_9BACI|nr:hypothetical protein [Bacillus oleivorans]SNX74175.1 hypothetical protein SAMN05877753_108202 [Bacillus oleivorans]
MNMFLLDFAIVSVLVIGLTALMGVLTNGLGETVFGSKNKNKFVDQTAKTQIGWRKVGGKKSS